MDSAYPGTRWRRQVTLTGDLVLVADALESAEERTFDWLLHGRGALAALSEAAAPETDPAPETTDLHNARWHRATPSRGVRWRDGDGVGLALWWQVSAPPDRPAPAPRGFPVERLDPLVPLRTRAGAARYAILLEPYRETPRVTAFRADRNHAQVAPTDGRIVRVPLLI